MAILVVKWGYEPMTQLESLVSRCETCKAWSYDGSKYVCLVCGNPKGEESIKSEPSTFTEEEIEKFRSRYQQENEEKRYQEWMKLQISENQISANEEITSKKDTKYYSNRFNTFNKMSSIWNRHSKKIIWIGSLLVIFILVLNFIYKSANSGENIVSTQKVEELTESSIALARDTFVTLLSNGNWYLDPALPLQNDSSNINVVAIFLSSNWDCGLWIFENQNEFERFYSSGLFPSPLTKQGPTFLADFYMALSSGDAVSTESCWQDVRFVLGR